MENGKMLVGSISYAIKAKRLLAKEGIRADLIKVTEHTSGCSYGLSFPARESYRVHAILSSAGIRIKLREDHP
ncbi:MAG: DUF3343 domain-containing protein [Clostridia bacterium]|nr:DUF3343 domain-containing protein [Clostridia bacterium]